MTREIRQAAFDVHSYFGMGLLEKVYENALLHRLRKAGRSVDQQLRFEVREQDGTIVGEYFADLAVDRTVLVEVKAASALAPEHQAQLLNYLKASGMRVGLLINFGRTVLQIRRLIL